MALCHAFSEIFNVEKYCDLEMLVNGQSRSLKVVPFDGFGMVRYVRYGFLLVFCSNFVPKMHHFQILDL